MVTKTRPGEPFQNVFEKKGKEYNENVQMSGRFDNEEKKQKTTKLPSFFLFFVGKNSSFQ